MSVIIDLDRLKDRLSPEQLEQLHDAAAVHQAQANIEFRVAKVEDNVIHIETTQTETRSGKYAKEAALVKKTHEVFDKWLPNVELQIHVFPHLPSPATVVTTAWLEKMMNEKGVRIKQIAFETGVDRESIADWVAGKRSMSQIVKAMFYFYLSR
ncbi:MAG: hypothetical protein JWQ28_1160 [Pedobacter sp.]|jgi:hypothetical protein|nr:hypothetical protein [Pedobacter sp.]